jgi:RecA-family ATPase
MQPIERARAYLSKVPPAISGQGGHNQTFAVACLLTHGFALEAHDVWALLNEFNLSCQPAWTEKELRHKFESALKASHKKPRGHLLNSGGYIKADFEIYKPSSSLVVSNKVEPKKYNPQNRTPLPTPLDDSCRRFILAAFKPGEHISMCDAVENKEKRSTPKDSGIVLTREQWLDKLDDCDGDPNKLFKNQVCGAFVRVNPTNGKTDADVEAFRHTLIEFDKLSCEDQFSILTQSNVPCTAILHSGGKSIHAWVKVDATTRDEYDERVAWIYEHFRQYGVDPKNKNPSRFSRLPGMNRGNNVQSLLSLNAGAESWLAWKTEKEHESLGQLVTIKSILDYDPNNDDSSVLGKRWLCRGGSCVIVGQSGIGKSSIAVQAACHWAAGLDFFGIKSTLSKPLKSLIIQAENDLGDVAEMVQGVIGGMENILTDEQIGDASVLIPKNVIFVRNQTHTGEMFCNTLRKLIEIHKPDLVWVDPLLAFFGDDISNQKACSIFLRNQINPILESSGVVLFFMHHTNKPDKDAKSKTGWTRNDYSYIGGGSNELTNWTRAMMFLKQIDDDNYRLMLTKRGTRAGARDLAGEFTRDIFLTHANYGIRWVQIEQPEETEKGRPAKELDGEAIRSTINTWMTKSEVYSKLEKVLSLKTRTLRDRWPEIEQHLKPNHSSHVTVWIAK